MVIYNLKNNKTKKINRLSKNGKNKNISRKTLKIKKNKHKKKNKHNKDSNKYSIHTKKQLIDRNKSNRTKKLVGGLKILSKINPALQIKKLSAFSRSILSLHGSSSDKFVKDVNIRTELKNLLVLQDEKIIDTKISMDSTKQYITGILQHIYFQFSDAIKFKVSSLNDSKPDSCLLNLFKNTNINTILKNDYILISNVPKPTKLVSSLNHTQTYLLNALNNVKLKYINERFLEFLIALKNSEPLINMNYTSINNKTTKSTTKTTTNTTTNTTINTITKRIQGLMKNIQKTENKIYNYDDKSNKMLFKCVKCDNNNLFKNKTNNIFIINFTEIYDIFNPEPNIINHYKNLKKKNKIIQKLLIDLYSYYTIFRVLNNDPVLIKPKHQ